MTYPLPSKNRPSLSRSVLVTVLAAHVGAGWALVTDKPEAPWVAAPLVAVQLLDMSASTPPRMPPSPARQPEKPKATVARVTTPEPVAAPEPEPESVPVAEALPPAPAQAASPAPSPIVAKQEPATATQCAVRVKHGPEPRFPEQLRQESISMVRVVLDVVIGSDGQARDIRVATSSGYPYVDAVVVRTLAQRWTFEPCHVDGQARDVRIIQPFVFKLKK